VPNSLFTGLSSDTAERHEVSHRRDAFGRHPVSLKTDFSFKGSLPMSTVLRTIEFLGLGLWLGSDVFLSFVVAPGAFRILATRDQAGAMVGYGLWWMHMIGVVCGITLLLARLLRTRTFASLMAPAALCVVLMIGLTVVSQHAISPRMAALRVQMGSIQATAADSPLLAEFSRLHRMSVSLESGVLLAGLSAMVLTVRELAAS
jgi:hypothetical protein